MGELVVILGALWDPHVKAVVGGVEARGGHVVVLDPSGDEPTAVGFRVRNAHSEVIVDRNALPEVSSVWWRVKPAPIAAQDADRSATDFREREWLHALNGLDAILADALWVNSRSVERRVRYKVHQLLAAARVGFAIPDTLVSNDADLVSPFVDRMPGGAVYKCLSYYVRPPGSLLFTNEVSARIIDSRRANLRAAPGIFQPKIEKSYELRITVVGDTVVPIRIDTADCPAAQLDWRRRQRSVRYSVVGLSGAFLDRLMALHRSLGLIYGAYDFIVTPDDDHVFLEVNPSGQWLWIEEETGISTITDALSSLLTSAGHEQHGNVEIPSR